MYIDFGKIINTYWQCLLSAQFALAIICYVYAPISYVRYAILTSATQFLRPFYEQICKFSVTIPQIKATQDLQVFFQDAILANTWSSY